MPTKYDKPTIEAIWTLQCMDVGATETMRRLASDDAGIGYEVQMPLSTVKHYRRELKLERGEPVSEIKPEDRLDAAHAIECRALSWLRRRQLYLDNKLKAGNATAQDTAEAIKIAKATQEMGRTRDAKAQSGADSARIKPPSTWLDDLSRKVEDDQRSNTSGSAEDEDGEDQAETVAHPRADDPAPPVPAPA